MNKNLRAASILGLSALFVWVFTSFGNFESILFTSKMLTSLLYCGIVSITVFSINKYLIGSGIYRESRMKFILLYFLFVCFYSGVLTVLKYFILNADYAFNSYNHWEPFSIVTGNFGVVLLTSVFASAILFFRNENLSHLELEVALKEKMENELKFLKSQINPHFVLNLMNTIYHQMDISNEKAKESLLMFSDLLRYQLYECNEDYIDLSKEVHYLNNYVSLQKLRLDENVEVSFSAPEKCFGKKIAPIILTVFLENAFKHVSNPSSRENYIRATLALKDNEIVFTCVNTFESSNSNAHGLGLDNVKRRLSILYPGQHGLEISDTNNTYHIHLKLWRV